MSRDNEAEKEGRKERKGESCNERERRSLGIESRDGAEFRRAHSKGPGKRLFSRRAPGAFTVLINRIRDFVITTD